MHKFTRRGSAVGTELAHFSAGSFARGTVREILLSSGRRVRRWMPEGASLRAWKHKALKRIDMYNELMHDEKERTKPMKAEDFTNE